MDTRRLWVADYCDSQTAVRVQFSARPLCFEALGTIEGSVILLASQAARIERQAKAAGLVGFDFISLLTAILPLLLQSCRPVKPEPVNPTPNPTPTQADAWTKAWRAKSAAVDNWDGSDYRPATVNKAAAKIRQQHRKDGTPIKKHEAQRLAVLALDDARAASMPDLYGNILEAEHHS